MSMRRNPMKNSTRKLKVTRVHRCCSLLVLLPILTVWFPPQVVSEEVVEALLKGMLLHPCWPRFKATWRYSVKSVNCLTDQFTKSQLVKQMSTDFFFKGNPSKFVSIGGEHIETVNFQFQLSVTIVESCIAQYREH